MDGIVIPRGWVLSDQPDNSSTRALSLSGKEELGEVMAVQLSRSVRWVDLIRKLHTRDGGLFMEVGPGNVISRTVRWIDRGIEILAASDKDSLLKVAESCKTL